MEADPVPRPVLPSIFRPGPDRPNKFNAFSAVPPRRMSMPAAVRRPAITPSPPSSAAALDLASAFQHLPFQRLKFVANDGQPKAKRRRIASACKTCRKRKTRCSGEKPSCETCKQSRQECLGYVEPTPKGSPQESRARARDDNSNNRTNEEPRTRASGSPTPRSHHRHAVSYPVLLSNHLSASEESARSTTKLESPLTSRSTLDREVKRKFREREGIHRPDVTDNDSSSKPTIPTPQQPTNRIPYFRYFGPTAIVPGYKQMVVEVRKPRPGSCSQSGSSASSVASPAPSYDSATPTLRSPSTQRDFEDALPLYEPDDPEPVDPLILHLVDVFFTHVGCNFPFLHKESFLWDVEEKHADALLVDAVCAVSARFSASLKTRAPSAAGERFSSRAKTLVVDTFACPSLSAVQACLLLAYAEFGSNRDSGLWMFLGCAIRMAQDLGLHKLAGMRAEGKRMVEERRGTRSRSTSADVEAGTNAEKWEAGSQATAADKAEEEADKRERTDTFWALYFLDRVISSGTGRPVTLKDTEIEIERPRIDEPIPNDSHPRPFPVLIHIIHLYGEATDILNNCSGQSDETMERLGQLNRLAHSLHNELSPKLHFNVNNFQHYAMVDQSSVFMLLHFWFHALIVLLHRPTILMASDGEARQLFLESKELSMASAKTIADIFSFAEAVDPDLKSVIGNPFNSQPLYIAACAFLQESAAHGLSSRTQSTQSMQAIQMSSVAKSPLGGHPGNSGSAADPSDVQARSQAPRRNSASHPMMALASQENYQRCHEALLNIERYWKGVKYILAVVDQKAKGVLDPLLYIPDEEIESIEVRQWGRKVWSLLKRRDMPVQQSAEGTEIVFDGSRASSEFPDEAIGLSMTGFTGSANTYSYQSPVSEADTAFPMQMATQQQHQQASPYAETNSQLLLPTEPSLHSNIGGQFQQSSMDSRALAEVFGAGGFSLEAGVVDMNAIGAEINEWYSLEYMPHGGDTGMGGFYGQGPHTEIDTH